MRVLVKICGLTRREDAEAAITAGADLVGFVFVPGTPRAVELERAGWIRDLAGAGTVGVFRDAELEEVTRARDALALDWVQLHGREPDAYLDALGERVLRRVPIGGAIDWLRVGTLARRCLPLFDPGAGDGRAADWHELARRPTGIEIGLAGGLTPDNVATAVAVVRPRLVDVSSGVERSPGIKDLAKVATFIARAKAAAAGHD